MKKSAEHRIGFGGERRLVERTIHQHDPAVAGLLIEPKGVVPHSQPGMSALGDIALGAAKSIDEKVAQTLLGARQVMPRIHRTQDVIVWHLCVEGLH